MAPGTKRIPRAIREQQMLDSAIQVFAQLGYGSASMDEIARGAEISKPMLYLYYGSKEELFTACVDRESERLVERLQRVGTDDLGPRELLRTVVSAFLDFVDTNDDSWNVVYRQAVAEPGFRTRVERIRRVLVDLTTELLARSTRRPRPRRDLEVVATALVGACEAVADRVVDGTYSRDEATAIVVDLAWQGLSGPGRQTHHTEENQP